MTADPHDFTGRRVRSVRIADAFLLQFLREGLCCHAVKGLPDDAAIVGAEYRGREEWVWPATVVLYVESPSFAPVGADEDPPEMDLVFRTLHPAYESPAPLGQAGAN